MNANALIMADRDHASDQQLGHLWERQFCQLAMQYRKSFTPHQIGHDMSATWYRPIASGVYPALLPDVTVWTAPGEHHEIKHKNPTNSGCYGLEQYRLEALLAFRAETKQPVLYTIHDWQLANAPTSRATMPNHIAHWVTVDVVVLQDYITAEHLSTQSFPTYVNGRKTIRPGYFWPITLWQPLEWWWIEIPF